MAYIAARRERDEDVAKMYAAKIQRMQRQLGVNVSSFEWLRMSAVGEEEDLAKYIARELTGNESFFDDEEEPKEIDPLYAYKD